MNIITLFNLNGHENIGWQFKDLTTESTKSTESFFFSVAPVGSVVKDRHSNNLASFSIRSKNNSMNMRGRTPRATFIFGFFFS